MIILRSNYDTRNIHYSPETHEDDQHELVTLDLHASKEIIPPGYTQFVAWTKWPFPLGPGKCMMIKTAEVLNVSVSVFGQVCSRGSLTAKGMLVANTKIDPAFHGPLTVCVFNASHRELLIEEGMAFCSVFFHEIKGEVPQIPRVPPDLVADRRSMRDAIRSGIRQHAAVVLLTLASTAIAAGIAAYIGAYMARSPAAVQSPAGHKR